MSTARLLRRSALIVRKRSGLKLSREIGRLVAFSARSKRKFKLE